jgi:putative ABC transport system permease protein
MQSDKSIVDFSNIDSCTWQWVKETPVAILEENELPAWKSAEDVCNALETMGADFIRYPAIGWGAHFYSKSDWLPKYLEFDESFDSSRDLFGEICSEIRSRGKKIMAYCHYGVLYRELEQIHPEWLARKPDGSLHMWQDIHRMTCLCNRDFITSMRMAIGEIIKLYRPDAIYIDGPTWYCPRCYCDCCKKEYLQMYGEEMPGELSYEDGSEVKYGKMRIKVIAEVVKGLSKIVREENNIPLIINTSMVSRVTYSQGRAELSYNYCDGANTTEVHRPGNFWDMIISAKAAQIFNKVSLCYCPPGPYHTLRTKDLVETEVMGFAYAMHAGTPMLQPLSSYLFDNTGSSVMNRFLNNIRKHPDIYYRSKPFEEVGLIYSRETTEALEASLLSKYHNNYSGVFNMLLHGHCHFNCLYDTVLSLVDLSRYKILILPENLTISKNTCDVLTMTALYSANLRVMGRSNVTLLNARTIFVYLENWGIPRQWVFMITFVMATIIIKILLDSFLKTQLGFAIRATGDNPGMARALGVNTDAMKILGLSISNGLVALSGALIAQYQGFSDIGMGIGTIVAGLASVIIGEMIMGERNIGFATFSVLLGSFIYRLSIGIALRLGFAATDLKLLTTILVIIALSTPQIKKLIRSPASPA